LRYHRSGFKAGRSRGEGGKAPGAQGKWRPSRNSGTRQGKSPARHGPAKRYLPWRLTLQHANSSSSPTTPGAPAQHPTAGADDCHDWLPAASSGPRQVKRRSPYIHTINLLSCRLEPPGFPPYKYSAFRLLDPILAVPSTCPFASSRAARLPGDCLEIILSPRSQPVSV
jgi:hypothetical protein